MIGLSQANKDLLRYGPVALYTCVDLYIDSGPYYFWDGPEDVQIGDKLYLSLAGYAGVSPIGQSADMGATGIELVLDASRLLNDAADQTDPAAFLHTIIADGGYRQRPMALFYSIWNADTGAHGFQRRAFTGLIDQMEPRIEPRGEGGGAALLIVRCESLSLRYGQRLGRTRSHEDQIEVHAGDDFFKLCAGSVAQERNLRWGAKEPRQSVMDRMKRRIGNDFLR